MEPRTNSASDEADAAIKEAIARARSQRARPRARSKRWYIVAALGAIVAVCLAVEPHAVPFVVMCAVIGLLCWGTFSVGTRDEPNDEPEERRTSWREIASSPERLHAWIEDQAHVEESGWAPSLVARAADRLRRVSSTPIDPRVIWIREPTAFAFADGRIYVSRELLAGASEADVALVLARAMAHLELGRARSAERRIAKLGRFADDVRLATLIAAVRPPTSRHADQRASELHRAAGYERSPLPR